MTLVRNFTRGPVFGPLVRFSIPFILSNALQVFYSIADMMIVGRFVGAEGLAAVSNGSRIFNLFTMVGIGLSLSGQVYLSQLIGEACSPKILNRAIGTCFSFLLSVGAVCSLLGILGAETFLSWMQIAPEAHRGALLYVYATTAGLLFGFGYNTVSAILRGMGDSKHPFFFIAIASCVNLLLDLLFIIVFHWGVFGAGLATILGQAVSFLFAIGFLYRRRRDFGFDFRKASFRMEKTALRRIVSFGLPLTVRFAAINLSMMYVMGLVNGVGLAASALFGAGVQMDDLATKVTQGFMQAGTAVVGQNWGARQYGRIRRTVMYAILLSAVFYAVYSFFLLTMPQTMFSFFTDDPEVLALAPLFAACIVWEFPALALMRGTNSFVNGLGNGPLALTLGILDSIVMRIGATWFLGTYCGLGLKGYILGFALSPYCIAIPALCYFLFWPWTKRGK